MKLSLRDRLLHLIYNLYAATLRVEYPGGPPPDRELATCYCFWHSGVFVLPRSHRGRGVMVLVSRHADGEVIAKLLWANGFRLARGSSTRGGERGAAQLLRAARGEGTVAITPDGPRGPRWRFKEGAAKLCEKLPLPVYLAGIGYSRFRELGSWDRFRLPAPFARCTVLFERVETFDPEELTQRLSALTLRAEEYAAGGPERPSPAP